MRLITNLEEANNHQTLIEKLILSSDKIILCSGWMKQKGLKELLPSLIQAIDMNGAIVTIFTNKVHTQRAATKSLSKVKKIKHILIPEDKKTLHSKIHYFQKEDAFTAIIGSANITVGGLVKSEELSVEIKGMVGSDEHIEIEKYLNSVEAMYC